MICGQTWVTWSDFGSDEVKKYLPLLKVRQKWMMQKRNLEINDLVVIVDEMIPRGQWPLRVSD